MIHIVIGAVALAQAAGMLLLLLPGIRSPVPGREECGPYGGFRLLAPCSLRILDAAASLEGVRLWLAGIQGMLGFVHGRRHAVAYARSYAARIVSVCLLVHLLFAAGALISEGPGLYAAGAVLSILIPWASLKSLQREVEQRKRLILMELPELLNRIVLLVNAGLPVQQAVIRCGKQQSHSRHPLYLELNEALQLVDNNQSFPAAMEQFGKRCSLPEVSVFATMVVLNERRGGEVFVLKGRELLQELWGKRKALTRIMAEQASSKLVFPLLIMFVAVLLVVASPAVMLLSP